MKKCYFIIVLIIIPFFSFTQDTLIMNDGRRIEVKILDISNDKIQYKTWSYQDGPTWIKSMSNIQSIRRKKDVRKNFSEKNKNLDFTACGSTPHPKGKTKNKKKILSGDAIVFAIDSIYVLNSNSPAFARRNILQYVGNLPEYIKRECIEKYYLDQFDRFVTEENVEEIVHHGEVYLYLGAEDELLRVTESLAMVFAADGDESRANAMIDKLKEFSAQNDNMLEEDISRISSEVHTLLHPRRFEDDICGKWVLLEKVSYKGFSTKTLYSPLILEINDVRQSAGAHLIDPEQSIPRPNEVSNPLSAYNKQINTSQAIAFDGQNMIVALQFASLNIKDRRWLTDLSHDLLSQNQDTRAKMNATISTAKASLGDKMAASLITSLTMSALDVLYESLNTSSKTDNVYNIALFPRTEDVLNAYVSHVTVTTTTSENSNPQSVYDEYVKDKRMRFVRWEEEDSLFFMSANGRPITLKEVSLNDPLLDEYHQIKKKHSLCNPAYLLPLIGGNALGAFIIYKGVGLDHDSFERDANGNRIPNGHGGYLFDEKKLAKAVLAYCGGGLLCIATSIAVPVIMFESRNSDYMEINRKNIEKLRQKAKASMSISPVYDPYNNTLGANIKLSF